MIYFKFTFPCKTVIEEQIDIFSALIGGFTSDSRLGCPLHGKKCLEVMKKNGNN